MEHTDREYCLEVWGDMACFTRPELKVERVSYDVMRRNEGGAVAGKSAIYIEEKRQQKNSLLLKDVRYRIWAKMEYRSVAKREI